MVRELYDKSGQDIFFQRESDTYGHIYDPEDSGITTWTQIPANYPHWRKLDYITDTFDPIIPMIEKLKIFDITMSTENLSTNLLKKEYLKVVTASPVGFMTILWEVLFKNYYITCRLV